MSTQSTSKTVTCKKGTTFELSQILAVQLIDTVRNTPDARMIALSKSYECLLYLGDGREIHTFDKHSYHILMKQVTIVK